MPLLETALTIQPSPVPLLRGSDIPHPERGVARGRLVRIRHGVYAPTDLWRELAPWSRYLARVHAVAGIHPDVVFCLESAAALLGLPVFGDPREVHVLVRPTVPARLFGGVRTHKAGHERGIVDISGLRMTSPGDTAVEIARYRNNAIGLTTADSALRTDRTLTRESLNGMNETRASSRGRNIARWPLERCTPSAETPLESISRAAIEWLGFPAPELQTVFRSRARDEDRVDFFWPAASLVGEADGDLKYDGRFGDPRTILRRQSARDARLRRRVRTIAHWGWAEVTAIAPLRGILSGSGLVQTNPEDSAQLASLKRLLAPRAPQPPTPARTARVQLVDEG